MYKKYQTFSSLADFYLLICEQGNKAPWHLFFNEEYKLSFKYNLPLNVKKYIKEQSMYVKNI